MKLQDPFPRNRNVVKFIELRIEIHIPISYSWFVVCPVSIIGTSAPERFNINYTAPFSLVEATNTIMVTRISTPKAKPLPPGVYTPVITIYDESAEQNVNLDAMYKHCQHLVNSGMHGLVYLGTNGELALLTRAERVAIIENARKAVTDLGLPDYPIVAGISAQSTVETIELTKESSKAGAAFGLLLPPSYWSKALSSDALLGYYRDVADASPIPVIVYNVRVFFLYILTLGSKWPLFIGDKSSTANLVTPCLREQFPGVTSGIDLDSDQLAALAAHPNIVATKLTCGNVGKLTRLTARFEPAHFSVYGGSSDFLLPALHAGAVGCVTGLGNVFPRSTSRIYDLFDAGRLDEARALQDTVAAAEWACKKSLACTKYGAWAHVGRPHLGLEDNSKMFNMRKPYLELSEDLKRWTLDTLKVLEDVENTLPGK